MSHSRRPFQPTAAEQALLLVLTARQELLRHRIPTPGGELVVQLPMPLPARPLRSPTADRAVPSWASALPCLPGDRASKSCAVHSCPAQGNPGDIESRVNPDSCYGSSVREGPP
jgi:hypothetical protein